MNGSGNYFYITSEVVRKPPQPMNGSGRFFLTLSNFFRSGMVGLLMSFSMVEVQCRRGMETLCCWWVPTLFTAVETSVEGGRFPPSPPHFVSK